MTWGWANRICWAFLTATTAYHTTDTLQYTRCTGLLTIHYTYIVDKLQAVEQREGTCTRSVKVGAAGLRLMLPVKHSTPVLSHRSNHDREQVGVSRHKFRATGKQHAETMQLEPEEYRIRRSLIGVNASRRLVGTRILAHISLQQYTIPVQP